jgi:hypothetical protein
MLLLQFAKKPVTLMFSAGSIELTPSLIYKLNYIAVIKKA